jgi:hypothetical protein
MMAGRSFTSLIDQQTFIGDLNSPKLGDQFILNGDLFDDSNAKVGYAVSSRTVVSVPLRPTEVAWLHGKVAAIRGDVLLL